MQLPKFFYPTGKCGFDICLLTDIAFMKEQIAVLFTPPQSFW